MFEQIWAVHAEYSDALHLSTSAMVIHSKLMAEHQYNWGEVLKTWKLDSTNTTTRARLLIFTLSITVFLSESSPRGRSGGPSGETALSTCHVGVGSLWPQTLHWQKVSTKRFCTQPAPQSEIQWAHSESNGHKVCDASRQVCWVLYCIHCNVKITAVLLAANILLLL